MTITLTSSHTNPFLTPNIRFSRDFRLPSRRKGDLRSSRMCRFVVSYRWFGTTRRSHAWYLKTGPIGCTETSTTKYQSALRSIPEQRIPYNINHQGNNSASVEVFANRIPSFFFFFFPPRVSELDESSLLNTKHISNISLLVWLWVGLQWLWWENQPTGMAWAAIKLYKKMVESCKGCV